MARHSDDGHRAPRRHSPAKTPEELENVLINKSLRLIESQIDDGTISATVLTQYAKLGSSRERLEQERLRNENSVLQKKLETMEAAIDVRNLMEDALGAFRGYTGQGSVLGEDEFDDY